jgi:hypothetical protein
MLGEFVLKSLNRIVLLVPSMFSNVEEEEELIRKGTSQDDIEDLRSKQCSTFLNGLSKLFWDKRWKFLTNQDGTPFLNQIVYGKKDDVEDTRFLCIFCKDGVETFDFTTVMNPLERFYMKKLFTTGWGLGTKSIVSILAVEGSHHAHSDNFVKILKHLNLKLDGTDVVVDIGYGTSALLLGLAGFLNGLEGKGATVYGSENSINVFNTTKDSCTM